MIWEWNSTLRKYYINWFHVILQKLQKWRKSRHEIVWALQLFLDLLFNQMICLISTSVLVYVPTLCQNVFMFYVNNTQKNCVAVVRSLSFRGYIISIVRFINELCKCNPLPNANVLWFVRINIRKKRIYDEKCIVFWLKFFRFDLCSVPFCTMPHNFGKRV